MTATHPADQHSGPALARRAFDVGAIVAQANTLDELHAEILPFVQSLGFSTATLCEVRGNDLRVLAGEPSHAWLRHFCEYGYVRDDIICREVRRARRNFFWSELAYAMSDVMTARQARIMDERRAFKQGEGFSCPMRHKSGMVTSVTFAGECADIEDPDVRAAIHVLASCYGLAARRLTSSQQPTVSLTTRQIDCLRWVLEGKSGADIGAILGISAYTVQEHLTDACARLGVRTRVQAAVVALTQNLLNLDYAN